MKQAQAGILAPIPPLARYLTFSLEAGSDPLGSLNELSRIAEGEQVVDAFRYGEGDDLTDALFRFTRPITGSYFWCPPLKDGRLDLSALGGS